MKRFTLAVILCASVARAQSVAVIPPQQEEIQVTATKIAEVVMGVPQSITIIDGADLRARGAYDLTTALRFVAGVSLSQGGDAGPATSIPEMGGLREADAFLLVVDGVPWGGAFNPDMPSVSLYDVERIEVVRGAAPVMYGATSFTGVIHVIHRQPGSAGHARAAIGTDSSGALAVTLPLVSNDTFAESLTADVERRGFDDERSGFDRLHLLYRSRANLTSGTLRFDVDAVRLLQTPSSPHPRQGRVLSPEVPLGANHNPRGAKLDQDNFRATFGFDAKTARPWTTTLSLARSSNDILRGFLGEGDEEEHNASGYRQDRSVTDVFFDSHVVALKNEHLRVIAGVDLLYGKGTAGNELFDYTVDLEGDAPQFDDAWVDEENRIEDRRTFSGAYLQTEWQLTPRLRVDLGARLNHTSERRETGEEDESESVSRSTTRGSGAAGVSYALLPSVTAFASYRNTFKPAAYDFGPEAEGELLRPETAQSAELGLRGRMTRIEWEASVFRNDLTNLLVSTVRNGSPALENGGEIRVDGAELETRVILTGGLRADLAYAYHDARFRDFEQAFDGVPTQLAGRRFEMSPLHTLALGLLYESHGWNAHAGMTHVGERYLTKRNTAIADAYDTFDAGLAAPVAHGTLHLEARNLTDEHPPVSESELGDAQYYRMPGRSVELSYDVRF